MSEADGIQKLLSARSLLRRSVENSKDLASALDDTGRKVEGISKRLMSLEAAVRPDFMKCSYSEVRDHADRAIGPAIAVMKIYGTVCELEMLLSSASDDDISAYLSLTKQLEDALKFMASSCRLAIEWLQAFLQFMEENSVADSPFVLKVSKCLRTLQELQALEEQARISGGHLYAAFNRIEVAFGELLVECCISSSALPVHVMLKLQAVIDRLVAYNRLEKCMAMYVQIRSLHATRSLEALDLDYLKRPITETDDVQDIEDCIDQWCKHLEFAVKHVFEVEYKLSENIFEKLKSDVWIDCFAKVATRAGILSFLDFGKKITECKTGPFKLLKLLEVFATLDNLRVDFNRLFAGNSCVEIQSMTRDLISRVVNGACEIFWQLPAQVELERQNSPVINGSIPKLVTFVTDCCDLLLGDTYKALLNKVLTIQQAWKQEKYDEAILTNQVFQIIREIGLNLDTWSKSPNDISLSYIFMMNNHCHFHNLMGTKLGDLMGDSWLRAHEQYKEYYMTLYLKETWVKILALLNQHDHDSIKNRLKTFNDAFDNLYEKQSNWIVPDEDLRLAITKLVVQALVPAYKTWLQSHGFLIEQAFSSSKCVKYSVDDLEHKLSSLFLKTRKSNSTKSGYFIDKIKNVVSTQYLQTLMAV